jgi:hypothetical protein
MMGGVKIEKKIFFVSVKNKKRWVDVGCVLVVDVLRKLNLYLMKNKMMKKKEVGMSSMMMGGEASKAKGSAKKPMKSMKPMAKPQRKTKKK